MTNWASGDAYEPYVGRWSRLVAAEFVRWLAVPAGRRWVDVGCGTGALTATILRDAAPASVAGVEPSEAFAAYAAAHVPGAEFHVAGATALPLADDSADVLVSGLVLNFVPDHAAAVAEARRVVASGGVVAAYVWDYADGMQLMRHFWDVAGELDPAVAALDEAATFPICRPDALAELWRTAFADVEVTGITMPTVFRDFDDYWTPFLAGGAPAPAYTVSLDADRQAALREALRARLPAGPDGSIALTARAWAVRGRVA
ncbi:MAG TPA: methyltransferase domain-containing protein [Frankiaceae bacterium]|nr:methyltransferase domain-containing protein [Frankiaceae bacterium]